MQRMLMGTYLKEYQRRNLEENLSGGLCLLKQRRRHPGSFISVRGTRRNMGILGDVGVHKLAQRFGETATYA